MDQAVENLKEFIAGIFSRAGFFVEIEDFSHPPSEVKLNIKTQERIILRDGPEIIDALEVLARHFLVRKGMPAEKGRERTRIVFDLQGERQRREEKLKDLARAAARKVRREKNNLELPPMNSFERRIIHYEISLTPDLISESIGEGDKRRVVIKTAGDNQKTPA